MLAVPPPHRTWTVPKNIVSVPQFLYLQHLPPFPGCWVHAAPTSPSWAPGSQSLSHPPNPGDAASVQHHVDLPPKVCPETNAAAKEHVWGRAGQGRFQCCLKRRRIAKLHRTDLLPETELSGFLGKSEGNVGKDGSCSIKLPGRDSDPVTPDSLSTRSLLLCFLCGHLHPPRAGPEAAARCGQMGRASPL